MMATQIQEMARRLFEAHGARAVPEAAQKAAAFEKTGSKQEAETWRRIEAALQQMQGPRAT